VSTPPSILRRLLWVVAFGVAFGYVEASVVVYLRGLYYPEGFTFPLKFMMPAHLTIELLREAATMVMLVTVAVLAGSRRWSRFGFFILGFGVWDIFYYVWLKVAIDWPLSLFDWDILFLIPLPWIGPVIAPVLISLLMIVLGWMIVIRVEGDRFFAPRAMSWILSVVGVACVLYSFMEDTPATLHGQEPSPYSYLLLAVCLVLCLGGFLLAYRPLGSPAPNLEGGSKG
jgi:hypothetical protein